MFTFFLSITGKLSFLHGTGEVLAWKMTGVKELGKGHTGGQLLPTVELMEGVWGQFTLQGGILCLHVAKSNLE